MVWFVGSGSTAAKLKALRWVPLAATDAAKSGVVPPLRRILPTPVLCPTASVPGSNAAADGGVRMRWDSGGGPEAVDADTDDDDGAVEGPKSGSCSEMGGGGMGADDAAYAAAVESSDVGSVASVDAAPKIESECVLRCPRRAGGCWTESSSSSSPPTPLRICATLQLLLRACRCGC